MMTPGSNPLYSETVKVRNRKMQADRIASYLMKVLRIPDGQHLVMFFGTGHECSNLEAISFWVERTLDRSAADEVEARLEQLANGVIQQEVSS